MTNLVQTFDLKLPFIDITIRKNLSQSSDNFLSISYGHDHIRSNDPQPPISPAVINHLHENTIIPDKEFEDKGTQIREELIVAPSFLEEEINEECDEEVREINDETNSFVAENSCITGRDNSLNKSHKNCIEKRFYDYNGNYDNSANFAKINRDLVDSDMTSYNVSLSKSKPHLENCHLNLDSRPSSSDLPCVKNSFSRFSRDFIKSLSPTKLRSPHPSIYNIDHSLSPEPEPDLTLDSKTKCHNYIDNIPTRSHTSMIRPPRESSPELDFGAWEEGSIFSTKNDVYAHISPSISCGHVSNKSMGHAERFHDQTGAIGVQPQDPEFSGSPHIDGTPVPNNFNSINDNKLDKSTEMAQNTSHSPDMHKESPTRHYESISQTLIKDLMEDSKSLRHAILQLVHEVTSRDIVKKDDNTRLKKHNGLVKSGLKTSLSDLTKVSDSASSKHMDLNDAIVTLIRKEVTRNLSTRIIKLNSTMIGSTMGPDLSESSEIPFETGSRKHGSRSNQLIDHIAAGLYRKICQNISPNMRKDSTSRHPDHLSVVDGLTSRYKHSTPRKSYKNHYPAQDSSTNSKFSSFENSPRGSYLISGKRAIHSYPFDPKNIPNYDWFNQNNNPSKISSNKLFNNHHYPFKNFENNFVNRVAPNRGHNFNISDVTSTDYYLERPSYTPLVDSSNVTLTHPINFLKNENPSLNMGSNKQIMNQVPIDGTRVDLINNPLPNPEENAFNKYYRNKNANRTDPHANFRTFDEGSNTNNKLEDKNNGKLAAENVILANETVDSVYSCAPFHSHENSKLGDGNLESRYIKCECFNHICDNDRFRNIEKLDKIVCETKNNVGNAIRPDLPPNVNSTTNQLEQLSIKSDDVSDSTNSCEKMSNALASPSDARELANPFRFDLNGGNKPGISTDNDLSLKEALKTLRPDFMINSWCRQQHVALLAQKRLSKSTRSLSQTSINSAAISPSQRRAIQLRLRRKVMKLKKPDSVGIKNRVNSSWFNERDFNSSPRNTGASTFELEENKLNKSTSKVSNNNEKKSDLSRPSLLDLKSYAAPTAKSFKNGLKVSPVIGGLITPPESLKSRQLLSNGAIKTPISSSSIESIPINNKPISSAKKSRQYTLNVSKFRPVDVKVSSLCESRSPTAQIHKRGKEYEIRFKSNRNRKERLNQSENVINIKLLNE